MKSFPNQRPLFNLIIFLVAAIFLAVILFTSGFVHAAPSAAPTTTAMGLAKTRVALTPSSDPTPIPIPVSASTSGIIFFAIVIVIVVLVGASMGMRKPRKKKTS